MQRSRAGVLVVSVAASVFLCSCGGGAATPAASTSPTPTLATQPSPPPGPGADAGSCPLGKGVVDADCAKGSPQLLAAVEAAIDRLLLERPGLFNTKDEAGANTGQYRVLDGDAYLDGVIANLRASGFCAERTIDRERVQLKSSNDFSEEWDVLSANGFIRRGSYSYQKTCTPAVFPIDPADLIAYVRTHLWSYECNPGIDPPPPGQGYLPLGCDGRVTATPKQRNGRDVPSWIHGPEVKWELREGEDIVKLDDDWRFADNPFDKLLRPSGKLGRFVVCATVLGKEGCLNGQMIR